MSQDSSSLDTSTAQVSSLNSAFWSELCGSALARVLGITDDSADSLRRFDDWYFNYYPYLDRHIRFASLRGKRVLEIGLGYGTVGQRIAASGADYVGLDIALEPVEMMRHRLQLHRLTGTAIQGNALSLPFHEGEFDAVVAIGSLHHTGHFAQALEQVYRVLRPGGTVTLMVYNAYSGRRWKRWRGQTMRYLLWDKARLGRKPQSEAAERAAYDANKSGDEPPATDFISASELRRIGRRFSRIEIWRENMGEGPTEPFARRRNREQLLETHARFFGLDLYARLTR